MVGSTGPVRVHQEFPLPFRRFRSEDTILTWTGSRLTPIAIRITDESSPTAESSNVLENSFLLHHAVEIYLIRKSSPPWP